MITFQRPCLSVRSLFLGASSTSASPVGSCVLFVWVLFFPFKLPWNGRGEPYMRNSPGVALPSTEQLPGVLSANPALMSVLRACGHPEPCVTHTALHLITARVYCLSHQRKPLVSPREHNPGVCYNYIPMHYSFQFKYNPVFLKNPLLANIQR